MNPTRVGTLWQHRDTFVLSVVDQPGCWFDVLIDNDVCFWIEQNGIRVPHTATGMFFWLSFV